MTKKVYKNMVPGGVYKPVGVNGITPATLQIEPVRVNGTASPQSVIPTER